MTDPFSPHNPSIVTLIKGVEESCIKAILPLSTVEFDEREKVHLIKATFCNVSLDVVDGNGDDDKNINNYVTMRLIMMIVAWSYLQRFYMELVDDNDDNHADHDDCILVQIGWR